MFLFYFKNKLSFLLSRMLNKQKIKQQFLDAGLKESSSGAYSNGLVTIVNKLAGSDLDVLEKPTKSWLKISEFKDKFSHLKGTTRRNYLSAAIAWLKLKDEVSSPLFTDLSELRDELNGGYEKRIKSGVKSAQESSLWVEPEVLRDVFAEKILPLLERLNLDDSKRKPIGNWASYDQKDLEKIRDLVILAIYLHAFYDDEARFGVQRNIISTLRYLPITARIKKVKFPDDKANYFVSRPASGYLFLQNHKTDSTRGVSTVELPGFLSAMLRKWAIFRQVESGGDLFEGMTKHNITNILQKYMGKYTGHKISSQMLRKIHISDRFKEENEEREELAHNMGHSTNMQSSVYTKRSEK